MVTKTAPEDLLKKRMKHLPIAIEGTLAKLDRLFDEAGEYRIPLADDWRWHIEDLRSRFLTDPKLINDHWEKTIREARKNNRG